MASSKKATVTTIDGQTRLLNPQEYVNSVFREAKSSFEWPIRLLPREKREAMSAIYAFCRLLDDEVDSSSNIEATKRKLFFFRNQIELIYSSNKSVPSHPVAKALAYHTTRFKLPRQHFMSIIEGFDMDLRGQMLKPSLQEFDQYCYNVASAVGLLSIEVFGYRNENTKRFAINLGKFMQLINIIRDVEEDARKGRIYIPQECLDIYGLGDITPQEIIDNPNQQNLYLAYAELGKAARQFLERAQRRISIQDRKSLQPALFMQDIYIRYLRTMEEKRWRFKKEDLKLSFIDKVRVYGRILTSNDN